MNVHQFDKFLSDNREIPTLVFMHPSIWNGYWAIKKRTKFVSSMFRFLGKKLKSRRVYWLGLSLYWVDGLKDWKEFEGIEPEEVYEI